MIAVGSKSVKIAGSKSSKTAVAKTCVRLTLVNAVYRNAHVLKDLCSLLLHFKVIKRSLKASSHKKFHRKIVDLLLALRLSFNSELSSLSFKNAYNDLRKSLIYLLVGSVLRCCLEIVVKNVKKLFFKFLRGNCFFYSTICHKSLPPIYFQAELCALHLYYYIGENV